MVTQKSEPCCSLSLFPMVRINYSLGLMLFLVYSLNFLIFPLSFSSKVVCHSSKVLYKEKRKSFCALTLGMCLSVFPLPVTHGMVASVDALGLCLQWPWGRVLLNCPVLHVSHSDVSMISHCLAYQLTYSLSRHSPAGGWRLTVRLHSAWVHCGHGSRVIICWFFWVKWWCLKPEKPCASFLSYTPVILSIIL